mmetsp:Transcript_14759/g.30473  ORF Transcript_14759/g.30473 Transcript_14759/m.30473 type:complete len:88 (+) Transcript_14759:268-531(+)
MVLFILATNKRGKRHAGKEENQKPNPCSSVLDRCTQTLRSWCRLLPNPGGSIPADKKVVDPVHDGVGGVRIGVEVVAARQGLQDLGF